jgi:hypothetical protein
MTKFGKGAYLFSADQNVEKGNTTSQPCGFHDNLQSTITTYFMIAPAQLTCFNRSASLRAALSFASSV